MLTPPVAPLGAHTTRVPSAPARLQGCNRWCDFFLERQVRKPLSAEASLSQNRPQLPEAWRFLKRVAKRELFVYDEVINSYEVLTSPMAFTISIATHKGGAGKSTTAMAISAAFARSDSKTLLIDLDAQGHSTLGLGVDVPESEPTLRDLFTEPPIPIARVIKHTHLSALDLIPSNIRLERVAQLLYTRPKREELLKRALRPVASLYEFIVLDCPPSLSPLTETGIGAADLIIVPCQMEARAPDGLVDLLEIISIIKGDDFTHWRILLTKLDSRKTTTNQAITEALSDHWADKMFRTTVPVSEPLNQAQIARTDIFTFDPKCKGALAYETLVNQELLPTYGQQKESTQAAR